MTGADIKSLRLARELSQAQLAAEIGLTLNAIQKLEAGDRTVDRMRAANFLRLADALGVEPRALLDRE